ncbi:hypothetical protein F4782DRAFT_497089 [Xylaria castorea]|nr:hypothetical protein F4782DRAFT_497089 [Xylaria castorea]
MWFSRSTRHRSSIDESEDYFDPFLVARELEKAEGKGSCIPRNRRHFTKYLSCSTVWGSTIL